jgi:hypothetical protein
VINNFHLMEISIENEIMEGRERIEIILDLPNRIEKMWRRK